MSSEAYRMIDRYPDRLPVLVFRSDKCKSIPDIDKHKYLVPKSITYGQFIFIIRKRLEINDKIALFTFINNKKLPPTGSIMSEIYGQYKDSDGFLRITYTGENTFG